MEKRQRSEERTDLIVGIITIAIFLALFLWMLISIGNNARGAMIGEIAAEQELRRGNEQVITYTIDKKDIEDGATVEWTVNGRKVGESQYKKGSPITLNYTPNQSGTITVKAKVGKYSQEATLEVKAPHLTVSAPNITVIYGEEPNFDCTVEGLLAGEEWEVDCKDLCKIDADKLNVGVYTIDFCRECAFLDYETEYVTGTLTVLPRTLTVNNDFDRVYNGTNTICQPDIELGGVLDGDDVCAQCDTLYFDSKCAGDKMIMLANVELSGEDAGNYVLESYMHGRIFPKCLDVVGLTVKDKTYDGTTKATIDTMGTLKGVCSGDSVAIGNIDVSFDNANTGKQKVVVREISLIGADKDNYLIGSVETGTGTISAPLIKRLTEKNPVAQGAN